MDVNQPRVRRRGFFLHSETGEPDTSEHENPEGFVVRVRIRRSTSSPRASAARRAVPDMRVSGDRHARTDTSPASVDVADWRLDQRA